MNEALVTGATGFIGTRLCKALKETGWKIRALALPGEDTSHIADDISEVVPGDITDPGTLEGIGNEIDVVFHLAARVLDYGSKKQFYLPIVHGTENMLTACAHHAARFVFVSSIAACGLGRHLKGIDETAPVQKSGIPYNDAKAEAELIVRSYQNKFKNGCTIVRPANVIGPRSAWVDEMERQFLRSMVPLIDKGRYSASLVYVDNLVDGITRAATSERASGQVYHFRDDWNVSWKRYLTDLSAMIGKKPAGSLPYPVAWTLASIIERIFTPLGLRPPITRLAITTMGRDNDVDNSKAKQELGWRTRVSYPEAMDAIQKWVKHVFR